MWATSSMSARRIDPGVVVALAWLGVAAGLTVVFGPTLGLRGWCWLGVHHTLALVGAVHELWRARRRRPTLPGGPGAQPGA